MIIGFNLDKISAQLEEGQSAENLNINSTPNIVDITRADVMGMDDVLRVKFSFVCKYEPEIGEIAMEGFVLWKGKHAKTVLKNWVNDQTLDADAAVEIFNTIFRHCLSKAVGLANEVRLPPPIQLPVVTQERAQQMQDATAAQKKGK